MHVRQPEIHSVKEIRYNDTQVRGKYKTSRKHIHQMLHSPPNERNMEKNCNVVQRDSGEKEVSEVAASFP